MKCPHCANAGKKLVLESRPHDGNVYRRRQCAGCGKTFVTEEIAHAEMPLPRLSGHARMAAKHGPEVKRAIRGDGRALVEVWR